MRIRPFLALACTMLLLVAAPLARAADTDPGAFLGDVSNQVLQLLNDKQTPSAQREQQFRKLADDTFDLPKIARFVLGPAWLTASAGDRQQFQQAFEAYIVSVYWSRFSQYSGQSFKVTGQQAQSADLTRVATQIVQPSGQAPVTVDWDVTKEPGGFKITDVSIEGVSQVLTYRQEFASFLERNGGQVSTLTAELNKRIKGQG